MKTETAPFLEEHLRGAARRTAMHSAMRMARMALAPTVFCVAIAVAVAVAGRPGWSHAFRLAALGAIVAGVLAPLASFLTRREDRTLAMQLDKEFALPDCTLAAWELQHATARPATAWSGAAMRDCLNRIAHSSRTPENSRLPGTLLVGGGFAVLAAAVIIWVPEPRSTHSVADVIAGEDVEALAGEWERLAREKPGPASEELLRAAESLRQKSQTRGVTLEETLLEIGRTDERLREKLRQNPAPGLDTLASAMQGLSDPIAGAIAQGDVQRAMERAREAFEQGPQNVPRFAELARRLEASGLSNASEAAAAMAGAFQDGESEEALAALEAALGGDAAARVSREQLELALMELAANREAMANSASRGGKDTDSTSSDESNRPGSGAGSDEGSEARGTATQDDPSVILPLVGRPNPAGKSLTVVSPSETGARSTPETPQAEVSASTGALSGTAIPDESLPLAHRNTIRRYFEAIRPQTPQP